MIKILAVCLGNICRSPVAEALLREKLRAQGYQEGVEFELDSAGTGDWHIGQAPDARSQQVCTLHGVDISGLRARRLIRLDGKKYDYILGMDKNNLDNIKDIIAADHHEKVHLFDRHEVNDPYYGIVDGFEAMYQQLERATDHWIEHWQENDEL